MAQSGHSTGRVVMSAFGSKADMKWCCDESPLLTQSITANARAVHTDRGERPRVLCAAFRQQTLGRTREAAQWGEATPLKFRVLAQ